MNEELYSYDKYRGFHIAITDENGMYYAEVYQNGTCLEWLKSINPDTCLAKAKDRVDAVIAYELEQEE